jgi:oligopeptide/dipeptide ABC transporter ATP-binding protein
VIITHDLGTLWLMADRVMVMHLGRVMEEAPAAAIHGTPAHPCTLALMSAHRPADPAVTPARHVLTGEIPRPINLPPGCFFASRCPVALPRCGKVSPALEPLPGGGEQRAACIRLGDGGNLVSAAAGR